MTNQQIANLLASIKNTIEDDLKEWNPEDSNSNNYFAYGPAHKEAIKDLKRLISYFDSHAKFEKELSEAYNEGWPDFVDGDII